MENTITINTKCRATFLKALRNIADKVATRKNFSSLLHEYQGDDYFHFSLFVQGKVAEVSLKRQWDFNSMNNDEEMEREARDLMNFIDEINLYN